MYFSIMSGVESSSPLTIKIASNKLKSIFWLIKESSNFEMYFSPLYVGMIALIPSFSSDYSINYSFYSLFPLYEVFKD